MDINIFNKNNEGTNNIPLEVDVEPSKTFNQSTQQNQSSDQLYLEKLVFRPELKKSWLNFFIANFRVVMLLMVVLSAWGLFSFFSLPRESNPEVRIPYAMVMTTYPGASPADIEELVTKKVETAISSIKDVKKITSNSSNSVSVVSVEFEASANLDDSIRKLRDQVNSIKNNLPNDASEPIAKEISFDDTPIWTIAVSGPYDGFVLRDAGDKIKEELEKISGVREVVVSGGDKKEFEIAYDPQKLILFNLSPSSVNQIISGANLAIPAGNFKGENDKYLYPVRVDGRFFNTKSLSALPIFHTDAGALVTLGDVAIVKEKPIEKTIYSRLSASGEKSQDNITIQILKKTGGSVVDTVALANKATQEVLKKLPAGITYSATLDMAKYIDDDFDQLTHDFILTLILVIIVLFLIVGFKEALVAGLAIPLVFFATFGMMKTLGISLNFLSVFSLILALGLLVDDAIVVVSATKQYLKIGKFTPEEAVLLVLTDFKVVLTTSTLTTVWAFLPLLMTSGIIGEFIKSIPITVSVILISSLIIALIINHPLSAVLERVRLTKKLFFIFVASLSALATVSLIFGSSIWGSILALIFFGIAITLLVWYFKKGRPYLKANSQLVEREWDDDELIKKKLREQGSHQDENLLNRLMHGIIHFNSVLPYYEKRLRKTLESKRSRFRTLAFVSVLFILAISLPATGIVQNEFFPVSDEGYVYVNIEGPVGLRLEETDKIVRQVEEKLLRHKEIENFSTIVGSPSSDSFASPTSSSGHLASITVKLVDKKERDIKSYDLAKIMRQDVLDITEAKVTITVPAGGPPSGAAFEARISGDDLNTLDKIARDLKPKLDIIPGVVNSKISLKESPADYTFTLNPNRLELYSLNSAYVGSVLRMAISGVEVTTILENGEETKVIARFDKEKLPSLDALGSLQILNLRNQPVFLKDVARIELKPSVETITRIDQKRTVLLSSEVEGQANSALILKEFQKNTKDYKLPADYEIVYGGENEQNTESVLSILKAMVLAVMLIISTLIIQFNSVRKALIVLVTIPLALIGVFFGLALTGISLSFPGLIGILALFGIVVKNAIILVDKINLNLKSGIEFKEAIVDAGKARLEAIFITSICTILGIIPITLSNEMWRSLGGAIIFGLLLSSFLTLFVVPILFMSWVKNKKKYN